jgi:hypothetical protein
MHRTIRAQAAMGEPNGALMWRMAVILLATLLTACGSSASTTPTGPSGGDPSDVIAVEVECRPTLYIGQRTGCVAVARLRSGATPFVGWGATWTSSHPEVAAVDGGGAVTGRSAGHTMIRAEYQGRSAQVPMTVVAEDALVVESATERGPFRPGNIVTMYLQGYYSVASADVARLSLRISDQRRVVTQTLPRAVGRGGDFFLLSSTFTVPEQSTQLCREAVLEVSGRTIAAPDPSNTYLACLEVRR